MTIRLLLVDDHAVVREGVGQLLDAQAGMRVIGSLGDGRDAVRYAALEHPDVEGVGEIALRAAHAFVVDEDRVATGLCLVLCAYLLPQTIPL